LGGDFASEEPKAKGRDNTVLYGVIQVKNIAYPQYPRIRVVYRKSFPPGSSRDKEIYPEIERLTRLPGVTVAKFCYDKVGVSDSVKNDLIGRGILTEFQLEPLTYSLPNKSEVYLNMQTLFQQDMLEGASIPELEKEILALRVEQPVGSIHIKVHHKTEGIHDDEPDALANACFAARSVGYFPTSFSFIENSNGVVGAAHKGTLLYCTKCENYHWDKCPSSSLNEQVPIQDSE
jgi:hypothetical protein